MNEKWPLEAESTSCHLGHLWRQTTRRQMTRAVFLCSADWACPSTRRHLVAQPAWDTRGCHCPRWWRFPSPPPTVAWRLAWRCAPSSICSRSAYKSIALSRTESSVVHAPSEHQARRSFPTKSPALVRATRLIEDIIVHFSKYTIVCLRGRKFEKILS